MLESRCETAASAVAKMECPMCSERSSEGKRNLFRWIQIFYLEIRVGSVDSHFAIENSCFSWQGRSQSAHFGGPSVLSAIFVQLLPQLQRHCGAGRETQDVMPPKSATAFHHPSRLGSKEASEADYDGISFQRGGYQSAEIACRDENF